MIMTRYGDWRPLVGDGTAGPEEYVRRALGDAVAGYDLEAVCADFRAAVTRAMPRGVVLTGHEFMGPWSSRARYAFEGYPSTTAGRLDFRAVVDGLDVAAIAAPHRVHYTAWLGTAEGELTVSLDELSGPDPSDDGCWSSTGVEIFRASLGLVGAHAPALAESTRLLIEGGWDFRGRWQAASSGYYRTVERAAGAPPR